MVHLLCSLHNTLILKYRNFGFLMMQSVITNFNRFISLVYKRLQCIVTLE